MDRYVLYVCMQALPLPQECPLFFVLCTQSLQSVKEMSEKAKEKERKVGTYCSRKAKKRGKAKEKKWCMRAKLMSTFSDQLQPPTSWGQVLRSAG